MHHGQAEAPKRTPPSWRASIAMATAAMGLVTGCADKSKPTRQELTVVLDTSEGPLVGATVFNVTDTTVPDYLASVATRNPKVRGEAVVFRLRDGTPLFALLAKRGTEDPNIFASELWPLSDPRNTRSGRTVKLVREESWPLLAWFGNPAVPATIQEIAPDGGDVNGVRIAIRSVWVEQVDQPVTDTILEILPWLRTHRGNMAGGNHYQSATFETRISARQFRTGY